MAKGTPQDCERFFDDLTISLSELAKRAELDEASLRRIRDGKPILQTTFNKFVQAMAGLGVAVDKARHFRNSDT